MIFLSLAGSGTFGLTILESEIQSAFTSTGSKEGLIDFSGFSVGGSGLAIDAFKIRETNDHLYVNLVSDVLGGPSSDPSTAVPEPLTAMLGVCSFGALGLYLGRRAICRSL